MKRAIALAAFIGLSLAVPLEVSAQGTPKRGGTLNFAISAETPNYDCHAHDTFAAIHFMAPFYSTLLQFDLKKYPEVRGDLADSWTVAPDLRSYTFKLKPNVVFHDGQPLTSADIKATYRNASFVANNRVVFNIKGNHYRLVVVVIYQHGVVYIRFVGTHQEYDQIDVTTI